MPLPTTLPLTVFTQRNFVADFLQMKCDFFTEIRRFAFFRPLWGTYEDHLRILSLIWKRVVDFLLALIELFRYRCYGWGATSDYRFKIGDFAPTGAGWPEISGRRGRPPPTILLRITRLNDLSYGINIWTDLSTVLSQFTRVKDGQTDGQTEGRTVGQNSHRLTASAFHAAR